MIVMFAEVRKDGVWHKVGQQFKSTYKEMEGILTDRVYDGHDLSLIAFLASDINCELNYIDKLDISAMLKVHHLLQDKLVNVCTLTNILKLKWDATESKTGCITEWQYNRLKTDGIEPVAILDKPLRKDAKIVTPFEMDCIIANPVLRTAPKYYVAYDYADQKLQDKYQFFCQASIPELIKLIPENGTTDDVRIIFTLHLNK